MISVTPVEPSAIPIQAVPARAFPEHVRKEAMEAVTRFSLLAAVTPAIPIPVLDSMTVSGLQLAMIAELSRLYGQTFSQNVAGSLLGAAGGGVLSFLFSNSGPGKAVKHLILAIPAVGPLLRWTAGPITLAGYTYLLGMAFIQHFETGGSFESFNRKHFAGYVQRAVRERMRPPPSFFAG